MNRNKLHAKVIRSVNRNIRAMKSDMKTMPKDVRDTITEAYRAGYMEGALAVARMVNPD